MKKGYKKGQAVMEYLITYGLALFVILVVLAILVAVVLPSLRAPETCQFTQPGFTCNQKAHVIVTDASNNVRILLQLDNGQGKAITLTGISCVTSSTGNVEKSNVEPLASAVLMAAGESVTVGDPLESDITIEVPCKNEDGTTTVLSANSNYKGAIGITYRYQDDVPGAPERLAVATVTGTVQAE
ncbi:hypothetical protein KKB44_06350 [Candidatus Micrarchaeota archaeon]|nr:hypothetical protein [Candidatus Micrarchaeota archaeon]